MGNVLLTLPVAAHAAGAISLEKTTSATVLLGGEAEYRLAVTNAADGGVEQYNLSYVDELPAGVTYISGSSSPSSFGEPEVITVTDDATASPPLTHQVLIWSNTADLTPGSVRTLTFRASVEELEYPVGSIVANTASAFTSSDPREVPAFDGVGHLDGGDNIASSKDSTSTRVTAIKLAKSEPSPESELLRGVNDHQTTYSLTVRNNSIDATTDLVVVDYLPAGLEFLGCGGAFNSSIPEYPGASNTVATVAGCEEPLRVETVEDPAGYPAGVYTMVTWKLSNLAKGELHTITYAAGIPQLANTMTWPGAAPAADSGEQAANLDNNTGASTRETASEQALTNYATVAGDFRGAPVSDTSQASVTAEDLRLVKSAKPSTFVQGQLATYTLSIDASEYVDLSELEITDTIPNGMCPIDAATNWTSLADCAAQAGHGPTNASISKVLANSDGSYTVTFLPDPTAIDANGHLEITYQALMRSAYGSQGPTSANDTFTNHAVISGTSEPRPGVESPDSGPVTVTDESSATISSGGPSLTKLRMANATPMSCSTDVDDYTDEVTGAEAAFTEGDRVCFLLTVQFPRGVDTRNAQLTDFLPANLSYQSSTELSPGGLVSSVTPTVPDRYVTWALGAGSPRTVPKGTLLQVLVSATVTKPAALGTAKPEALDKENLAKFRYTNTAGLSDSLRDSVVLPVGPPPPIGLIKGVQAINSTIVDGAAAPANVDGSTVRAGDMVTFRIDLANLAANGAVNGDTIANPDVWDVLPAGITCAAITAISNTGTCYDPGGAGRPDLASGDTTSSIIRWKLATSFTLAPQASGKLTYSMQIPAGASVSTIFTNTAAVASYTSATNINDGGTAPVAVHNPASNVSGDVPLAAVDVPAASDTSFVVVPDAKVAKVNTTAITEMGNTATQAVVGEQVTYTVGVTIPAHTTVYNGTLTDVLPAGVVFVGPATAFYSAAAKAPVADPLPDGVSVDPATGTLTFGPKYSNTSDTDQLFQVTIPARIGTDASNTHGTTRTNTATFTSDTADTGGQPITPRTAGSTVVVVAPAPTLTKSASPGSATGGDTVTYTLLATNASGRPPLHDTWLVDCLPDTLTFGAFTTVPAGTSVGAVIPGDGTNGCATGYTRITWKTGNLAGGSSSSLKYTATVNAVPAGGDQYINTANLKGSTLNDGKTDPTAPDNPLERVLTATSNARVTVAAATITKTAAQTTLTIGQVGSFTVKVTIPKNTAFYDSAILDALPTGMSYVAGSSSTTCTNADATGCSVPGTELTPSGSTIGWLTGDLAPSSQTRTVTITYTATMNDIAANTAGTNRTNTARFAWNKKDGTNPSSVGASWGANTANATATVRVVEPGLSVAKAVDDATVDPGQVFHYTLTVANNSRTVSNLSPAYNYTITDTVPAGVVVDPASIVGGVLTGTDANGSGGTITWGPIAGPLAANASTALTYAATLAPSSTLTATPQTNTARVTHYESLPAGGRTNYPAVSSTATVTPRFPHVTAAKTAAPGPAYLGKPKTWTITVTNDSSTDAHHVTATDTLPPNWTYDAGTATVVVAGGPASQVEPTLSTDGSGHQVLTWTDLGTAPATGTTTITITFTATPSDPAAATDPGVGAGVAHTNTVGVTAQDATGATGNATGPYNAGPATASTHIDSADVQVHKSSGDAVAGQNLTYTLLVKNAGPDTAVGPFPLVDTLPAGLGAVAWSGAGWTCSLAAGSLTCARTNPADTLASGASFPTVTVTAAVPADTADTATLTNAAIVGSSTHDPDSSNNTDQVTDTVARLVDLGVVKHTVGTVTAGADATYTLDVTNHGPSDSAGPIVVTDNLPSATSFVSATGTGWACDTSGQTLTCTRAAGLVAGAAAPQVTIRVHVHADADGTLKNTAEVHGPETDPNPKNDTDSVTDPVETSADLAITKAHVGSFTPGSTGTYEFTVTNNGPSDAAATVSVVDHLAPELTYRGDDSDEWACSADASNVLTCNLGGTIGAGKTRTFRITVDINPAHTGSVANSATVSSPTNDPHLGNNTDGDTTAVDVQADLGIVKSHSGRATAGDSLDFTLVVSNHGRSDSPGTITVSDTLPVGMTFVSASGAGWSCTATGRAVTCTRAQGLAAGDTAPHVTVRVKVAANAGPNTLTNWASVSGPAPDPVPANDTDSDDVTVSDRANVKITKVGTPAKVDAGAKVTWTLTISNDGPSDADNVQVTDALPPGLSYVSVDADPGVMCADGNPIDCHVTTMPAGASYQIVIHSTVGSAVGEGTRITNTATIDTSTDGDDPDDNTSSDAVTVTTSADLVIRKTHSEDPVVAGHQMTFNLDVRNVGPSDAAADVVVTDTLPVGMTYVSSPNAAWLCTAGDVAAAGQAVTCTLAGGAAVLADTHAPLLELVVQVASEVDPGSLADGQLVNTAEVSSATEDPKPDNNSDNDKVTIATRADLSITKTHSGTVRIGDPLEFALQVANGGPSTARRVVVTDTLPMGLSYVSATGDGWTCSAEAQTVTCELLSPLPSGESAAAITVRTTVLATAYPQVSNTATVESATIDPTSDNNTSTDTVAVPPQVDLGITKSHQPEPMQVGQVATYTIGISNAGNTDDPGPITVTDVLPTGLTFVSGAGDGWTCRATGQAVTCVREAGLRSTANSAIALVVNVEPGAYPAVTNTATVASPAEDTNPDNNTASDPATVLPLFDLVITKDLDSISTTRADWRITVTNNGPNEAPGAVVTDDLPSELSFVGSTGDGWTCTPSGQLVTCAYVQTLAVGQTIGVTLHTAIDAAASGSITNSASVDGGNTDTATGTVPPTGGGLAYTGGITVGAGLLGLALIVGGLLLVRSRRRPGSAG